MITIQSYEFSKIKNLLNIGRKNHQKKKNYFGKIDEHFRYIKQDIINNNLQVFGENYNIEKYILRRCVHGGRKIYGNTIKI